MFGFGNNNAVQLKVKTIDLYVTPQNRDSGAVSLKTRAQLEEIVSLISVGRIRIIEQGSWKILFEGIIESFMLDGAHTYLKDFSDESKGEYILMPYTPEAYERLNPPNVPQGDYNVAPSFVKQKEVAEFFGVDASRISQLHDFGFLKQDHKIGNVIFYNKCDVEALRGNPYVESWVRANQLKSSK